MLKYTIALAAAVLMATTVGAGIATQRPDAPSAQASSDGRLPVIEPVVGSATGLAPGWLDFGYSPHMIRRGSPVEVDLGNYGGLILAHPDSLKPVGGLAFRYRAPDQFGDFLEVQLQSASGEALARVPVDRSAMVKRPDGFLDVWLPIGKLNPSGKPFARVMFFAHKNVGHEAVLLDQVGFTAAPPPKLEPARTASFTLDCGAAGQPISPLIYGGAGDNWATGITARRWGGNPTSRYNWEMNTENRAKDWFFRNSGDPKSSSYEQFLSESRRHGVKTAFTVPMLGWVAKDATSYSFPVSVFGAQQATDGPDMGNGIGRDGKPIAPGSPTRTSVPSTPESIERWVRQIRNKDGTRGRSVDSYILDNEPMLWNSTHRDVHPEPTTYDELLEKTIAYASAVRRADPDAKIAGPAEWGWLAYHYSAKDVAAGVQLRPDRRLHGDEPLIPWYLRKIREYEQKNGARLLDILDVHFYPMAQGMGIGTGGDIDPATAARRIRSTRSLWDPTYVDESWINERMRVLPLLRQWIAENHPGLGTSIGEWNFGAESHMSGGLAAAEALGRFGTEGLTSAYYWFSPPDKSPVFWAFRAFRDFDGAGAHFQDWSVPVKGDGTLASFFASRDEERRRVVAVLLNLAPLSPLSATVSLEGCRSVASARAFTYSGGDAGFTKLEASPGQAIKLAAAPYSITVLDLSLSSSR